MVWRLVYPWYAFDWLYYNVIPAGRKGKQQLAIMHAFTNRVISEKERSGSFVAKATAAEGFTNLFSSEQY